MAMYQTILVPTDGSACGEKAIDHALQLAGGARSTVVFLFVMDTARNYDEGLMPEVRQKLADEGARALARARQRAADAGVEAQVKLVEGDPAEVILEDAPDFDLVVMGSHGKGLWRRLMVGSVSQSVLRRVTSPLLLVPCPRGEAS